jgi:hypothetical protein
MYQYVSYKCIISSQLVKKLWCLAVQLSNRIFPGRYVRGCPVDSVKHVICHVRCVQRVYDARRLVQLHLGLEIVVLALHVNNDRVQKVNLGLEPCGIPKPKPKPRFILIPNPDRSLVRSFFGIGIPDAVWNEHSSSIWHQHLFHSSKGTRDMKPYILL